MLPPSLLSFFFARKIPFYPLRPRKGVTTPPPQRLTPTPPSITLYLERGALEGLGIGGLHVSIALSLCGLYPSWCLGIAGTH